MNIKEKAEVSSKEYNYENDGWPRDFDIRIEVAEQQEVLVPQSVNSGDGKKVLQTGGSLKKV